MKPTWYRAETSIGRSHTQGTTTLFLKYDLRCWTFGLRFQPDDSWFALHLDFGPFEVEACYWRRYVFVDDQ